MEAREPPPAPRLVVNADKAKHESAGESANGEPEVHAAGGIVRRRGPGALWRRWEIALVHRPRYDDWTFPKGKREGRETDEETALREVLEETGFHCHLGRDLGEVRYRDGRGRTKTVRYWLMGLSNAGDDTTNIPNREVDELRWCRPRTAAKLLTYEHDLVLLDRLERVAR